MRVYSAFLIALLFRAARASADRRSRRRGRATDRRRLGARRAAQLPPERRVDPVQLLQLEDEGRHRRRADRARRAVARRSARDAAEPRVVARAPRVQPSDPRPLRRQRAGRWTRPRRSPRARPALGCCSRSTTRKSRRIVSSRDVAGADRGARQAAHGAESRRGGWTSPTSASRNRRCGCSKAARDEAARAAREAVTIGRERGPAGDADSALPRARGAVASAARRRSTRRSRSTTRRSRVAAGVDARNFRVQRGFVARARGAAAAATRRRRGGAAARTLLRACRERRYAGFLRQMPRAARAAARAGARARHRARLHARR